MNQANWTEYERKEFLHESGLTYRSEMGSNVARELISVLKKHIADETNEQIAEELHIDKSKVDADIRELKNIYDDIVYYTAKLIPRENLTKKDIEIQEQRFGFELNIDNLRKFKGFYR